MRRIPQTVRRLTGATKAGRAPPTSLRTRSISHAASSSISSTSAGPSSSGTSKRSITTSKQLHSPATAQAADAAHSALPIYAVPSKETRYEGPPLHFASSSSSEAFQPQRLTILPTPLPENVYSESNESYYPSTSLQDRFAVIDICLHGLLDVERASKMFDDMRRDLLFPVPESLLDVVMYNKVLDAYFLMMEKDVGKRDMWLDKGWNLYEEMAYGKVRVKPNATTFSIALSVLQKYPSECTKAGKAVSEVLNDISDSKHYKELSSLEAIVTREGLLETSRALELVDYVTEASTRHGHSDLAREVQSLRVALTKSSVDPLENVPEVQPVQKEIVSRKAADTERSFTGPNSTSVLGEPEEPKFETPFNIKNLQTRLKGFVESRNNAEMEDRQKAIENLTYEAAKERWEQEHQQLSKLEINTGLKQNTVQGWMWQWYNKLRERLESDIRKAQTLAKEHDGVPVIGSCFRPTRDDDLGPFITCLPADKLAIITIMEALSHQGAGGIDSGVKTTRALKEVGKAIEAEYQARLLRKHKINYHSNRVGVTLSSNGLQSLIDRRVEAKKVERRLPKAQDRVLDWTEPLRLKVGAFCMDALMDTATVERTKVIDGVEHTEEQPAFSLEYEYVRGFKIGVVRLNAAVSEKLASDNVGHLIHPRQLPMVVRPRPWIGESSGAYLGGRSMVMRMKNSVEQSRYLSEAAREGKLEGVFRGLDVLSSTPWIINRDIFNVVLKVWNDGVEYPSIPPANRNVVDPVKPENYETDLKAKADHLAAVRTVANQKRNNHSERCSTNYKVEIARAFLGEKFYLPHNVDFRGRAYPIPPHLSQVGDDLSRGLLKFAEKRPLGVRGLRWLKIHLANVFGNDKATLDDRAQFTMDHLDDVYDSAMNPLDGRQWWRKADDPWQCLATCMELRAALESPDPLAFMSNLPVHQDGTCNGLQHYAALGGDAIGAAQVNLDVTEKPSDVYTYVANMVEAEILKDIEKGNTEAKYLTGKVSRKVVKQTVMTTVYGVTMVGARAQIERQLVDRGDIPIANCWSCASYLAKKTLGCIGDLFKGANAIQNWLTQSARVIARSVPPTRVEAFLEDKKSFAASQAEAAAAELEESAPVKKSKGRGGSSKIVKAPDVKQEQMTSVIWTTVLGLPIVQPYRKVKRRQVFTNLQSIYISDPSKPAEVSPAKQASAFPPNFIHSLDATHMMLSALEMQKSNLTFASVHDSYWTHAASVDDMSVIIRDTFVWLHSQDILKGLQDEFRERYAGHKVPRASLTKADLDRIIDHSDMPPEQKIQLLSARGKLRVKKAVSDDQESSNALSDVDSSADGDEAVPAEGVETVLGPFVDLNHLWPPMPEKGSFDVSRTKNSPYFFS
ncbi:DNA-directed RNA polymerase [Tulasnella sp. JGI-2019a]|nr:DNA-directed RNA polymerase [Tulasnella sp. JGI-2019a]KAG9037111.1 DNA-directed RNA polymerase [Tulasnella sp. JGI-2019a]